MTMTSHVVHASCTSLLPADFSLPQAFTSDLISRVHLAVCLGRSLATRRRAYALQPAGLSKPPSTPLRARPRAAS